MQCICLIANSVFIANSVQQWLSSRLPRTSYSWIFVVYVIRNQTSNWNGAFDTNDGIRTTIIRSSVTICNKNNTRITTIEHRKRFSKNSCIVHWTRAVFMWIFSVDGWWLLLLMSLHIKTHVVCNCVPESSSFSSSISYTVQIQTEALENARCLIHCMKWNIYEANEP